MNLSGEKLNGERIKHPAPTTPMRLLTLTCNNAINHGSLLVSQCGLVSKQTILLKQKAGRGGTFGPPSRLDKVLDQGCQT